MKKKILTTQPKYQIIGYSWVLLQQQLILSCLVLSCLVSVCFVKTKIIYINQVTVKQNGSQWKVKSENQRIQVNLARRSV